MKIENTPDDVPTVIRYSTVNIVKGREVTELLIDSMTESLSPEGIPSAVSNVCQCPAHTPYTIQLYTHVYLYLYLR